MLLKCIVTSFCLKHPHYWYFVDQRQTSINLRLKPWRQWTFPWRPFSFIFLNMLRNRIWKRQNIRFFFWYIIITTRLATGRSQERGKEWVYVTCRASGSLQKPMTLMTFSHSVKSFLLWGAWVRGRGQNIFS